MTIAHGESHHRFKGCNVILISIDALRADHLGMYGYKRNTSPNMDAFAETGIVFENAFAQAHWTLPSHASILTSRYPSQHGLWTYRTDVNASSADELRTHLKGFGKGEITLAEILRKHGYATIALTSGGYMHGDFGFKQGFSKYWHYPDAKGGIDNNVTIFKALENVTGTLDEPFFIFCHTYQVHEPYAPHPPYDVLFSGNYHGPVNGSTEFIRTHETNDGSLDEKDIRHLIALYDGGIRSADDLLGSFFAVLNEKNLASRTLIIITSDHGEEFWEHGIHQHQTPFDNVLRVPLIIKMPHTSSGRRIRHLVRSIDITPTILDYLHIDVPKECEGKSLLPTIYRNSPVTRFVFAEQPPYWYSVRDDKYKFVLVADSRVYRNQLRASGFNGDLLFDIRSDPQETVNLARHTSYAKVADEYKKLVLEFRARISSSHKGTPGRSIKPNPDLLRQLKSLGYMK